MVTSANGFGHRSDGVHRVTGQEQQLPRLPPHGGVIEFNVEAVFEAVNRYLVWHHMLRQPGRPDDCPERSTHRCPAQRMLRVHFVKIRTLGRTQRGCCEHPHPMCRCRVRRKAPTEAVARSCSLSRASLELGSPLEVRRGALDRSSNRLIVISERQRSARHRWRAFVPRAPMVAVRVQRATPGRLTSCGQRTLDQDRALLVAGLNWTGTGPGLDFMSRCD